MAHWSRKYLRAWAQAIKDDVLGEWPSIKDELPMGVSTIFTRRNRPKLPVHPRPRRLPPPVSLKYDGALVYSRVSRNGIPIAATSKSVSLSILAPVARSTGMGCDWVDRGSSGVGATEAESTIRVCANRRYGLKAAASQRLVSAVLRV